MATAEWPRLWRAVGQRGQRSGRSRPFSATAGRRTLLDAATLPERTIARYRETASSTVLALRWPRPPRNVLIIPKLHAPHVMQSAVVFAEHLARHYPDVRLVFEQRVAEAIHASLPCPVYTTDSSRVPSLFPRTIDLVVALGGDGTILRAASLFALDQRLPPVLSFSMGTLGFLGEWQFEEHERAWREVYMSGRGDADAEQTARILLRNRLRVRVYDRDGVCINDQLTTSLSEPDTDPDPDPEGAEPGAARTKTPAVHALNELLIHRGPHTHLAIIDIYINGHFLTEAVADGILVSTPTGSTAYSLSAGGSIIHPLVRSLLITPICPRSLSFRPLVLPQNTRVALRLSERNRSRAMEVSIDGQRKTTVGVGMEVRVEGEEVRPVGSRPRTDADDRSWHGGVPCVIRAPRHSDDDGLLAHDDGWVGGLNGLLKFNYPFGDGRA